jgi:lysophospholipase L1-like esterase
MIGGAWAYKRGTFRGPPARVLMPASAGWDEERAEHRVTGTGSPGAVVIAGDSTANLPLVSLERRYAEGGDARGWAALFREHRVVNRAIPGDTIAGLHRRVNDLIDVRPSRVILLIGVNDLASSRSPVELAVEYGEVIGELKRGCPLAAFVVVSVLPNRSDNPALSSASVVALNRAIRAEAERRGAVFVDLWPTFAVDGRMPAALTYDGIHLTVEGEGRWADTLLPIVGG